MAKISSLDRVHSACQTLTEIYGTALGAAGNWVKTTEVSSPTRPCGTISMIATTLPWTISCEGQLIQYHCTPETEWLSYLSADTC